MTILVSGGAGFIGTNYVLNRLNKNDEKIVVFDKLTYAGNIKNFLSLVENKKFVFIEGDILDKDKVKGVLKKYKPRAFINFAAESHVDNSILKPEQFVLTNVLGTYCILEVIKSYYENLTLEKKDQFKFLNISTDEVYGSLSLNEKPFTENSNYMPNSPYSASKAGADHLVRSFNSTFNIPVITTNCSNNYGPYQHHEKLLPLIINNAISWKKLPIYGNGENIRDWIFVLDHCNAIDIILDKGKVGETYNIGADTEIKNIKIVTLICELLDSILPNHKGSYASLITFVEDRLGHDKRYAINCSKLRNDLGWRPKVSFKDGLVKTINWYLNNKNN
tara:strand:- start:991 stop:1992 length:1002 start_codon:yes stop_codon:yes gene_type:complete